MSKELAIGLILGMLAGGTISAVFMGTVAHNHYEKYRIALQSLFMVEEELIHCMEGKAERVWQLRSDGMDTKLVRGRPDLESVRQKRLSQLTEPRGVVWDDPNGPPQYISLTDIDDLPAWEGEEEEGPPVPHQPS